MHGGSGNDGGYADPSIYFSLFFSPSQGHKQVSHTVHDLTLESLPPEGRIN